MLIRAHGSNEHTKNKQRLNGPGSRLKEGYGRKGVTTEMRRNNDLYRNQPHSESFMIAPNKRIIHRVAIHV